MHHHHPLTIPLLCAFWQGAYYTQPVYAAQPHVIHHTTVVQPNSIPSTALYPAPVPVPAPRNNGMAAMGMVAGTTMAMSAGTVSKSCSLVSPYVRGLPKTVMIAFLETAGSVQLQTVREECLGWVALGTYRKTCLDRFLTLVVPNPFFYQLVWLQVFSFSSKLKKLLWLEVKRLHETKTEKLKLQTDFSLFCDGVLQCFEHFRVPEIIVVTTRLWSRKE